MNYSQDMIARFWSKVNYPGNDRDCWEWLAYYNFCGYGQFFIAKGQKISAHRFSWEFYNGPITNRLNVLHKCDNPLCCNPEHLFLGTTFDNSKDMVQKGRSARGSLQGNSKLSETDVVDIKRRIKAGESNSSIGQLYSVSPVTISGIRIGKNWNSVVI